MTKSNLPNNHKVVLDLLKKKALTSFQILNNITNVSLILVVYNILDELKNLGIIKSFVKEDKVYHCLA